jgi:hypothetical protein
MSFVSTATDPYRIAFVCLGTICCSPIAEVGLRSLLAEDDELRDRGGRLLRRHRGLARGWTDGDSRLPVLLAAR